MPSSEFRALCPLLVIDVPERVRTTMADKGQGRRGRGREAIDKGSFRMGSGDRGRQRGIGILLPTDPTDPEVPAAKRLRDARRRRSLILVGSAIAALLLALLVLVYRMEQQVTTVRSDSADVPTALLRGASIDVASAAPASHAALPGRVEGADSTGAAEARLPAVVDVAVAGGSVSSSGEPSPGRSGPSKLGPMRPALAPGRTGSIRSETATTGSKPASTREIFRRPAF
jgi:hypothetical protein